MHAATETKQNLLHQFRRMHSHATSRTANVTASAKMELLFDTSMTNISFWAESTHKLCISVVMYTHNLALIECLFYNDPGYNLSNINLIPQDKSNRVRRTDIARPVTQQENPFLRTGDCIRNSNSELYKPVLNSEFFNNGSRLAAEHIFRTIFHPLNLLWWSQSHFMACAASRHSRQSVHLT